MQEGQKRKTSSMSILAIAGVEPYQEKSGRRVHERSPISAF
ncbi:RNA polymerase-binding transcription factor [Proteus penneri ATCC 35198]|nr:RNA polymerase-binding transcription factor [Proteus penneri ATCC 35198]